MEHAGSGRRRTQAIPPFLLLGIVFCISGLIGLLRPRGWQIPLGTLAVGVGGIFGYHFFYFRAFALAPAVEVNLINYLWPLLIVVLSPLLLKGYRLRPNHVIGALLGVGRGWVDRHGGKSQPGDALPAGLPAGGWGGADLGGLFVADQTPSAVPNRIGWAYFA